MFYNSVPILQSGLVLTGVCIVSFLGAMLLRAHKNLGPTLVFPVAVLLSLHLGGWFDIGRAFRATREAGFIWLGMFVYISACMLHARVKILAKVRENIEDRYQKQVAWFEEHGLNFELDNNIPTVALQRKFQTWLGHQAPHFDDTYSVLSHHKMDLFWTAYFAPIDFVLNFWDLYLKEVFVRLLEIRIVQIPFERISERKFAGVAVHLREAGARALERRASEAVAAQEGAAV